MLKRNLLLSVLSVVAIPASAVEKNDSNYGYLGSVDNAVFNVDRIAENASVYQSKTNDSLRSELDEIVSLLGQNDRDSPGGDIPTELANRIADYKRRTLIEGDPKSYAFPASDLDPTVSNELLSKFEEISATPSNGKSYNPPLIRNQNVFDYPINGIGLGDAWNSIKSAGMKTDCLIFTPGESGGQAARVESTRVMDSESLRKEVGLSTSVEAKGSFGAGSAGGSFKQELVRKSTVATTNINLLVKASVIDGREYVGPLEKSYISTNSAGGEIKIPSGRVSINPDIVELLGFDPLSSVPPKDEKTVWIEKFLDLCGNRYVSEISRGAELFALYQYTDTKKSDSSEKKTAASVSGGFKGFSASASMQSSKFVETVSESKVSNINYFHSAHAGLFLPHDEESINESLRFLGNPSGEKDSFPFKIHLANYQDLPGWQLGDIRSAISVRDSWIAYRHRYNDLKKIAVDMRHNPENYYVGVDAEINNLASAHPETNNILNYKGKLGSRSKKSF